LAFRFVSIVDIFVATLVVPYNKLLDAAILGAVIVVPVPVYKIKMGLCTPMSRVEEGQGVLAPYAL